MLPPLLLLFGATGLLGTDVRARLAARGAEMACPSRAECDLSDPDAVARRCAGVALVVNCAAYNAVERGEVERDVMTRVNAEAPAAMARAAARVVHVSTDFVFDGAKGEPYVEEDEAAPLQAYGHTKLAADRAVLATPRGLVVRSGCLFGRAGRGFTATLLPRLRAGERVRADDERRIRPTWTGSLADQILALVDRERAGLYHAMCAGETTWAGFARELARQAGLDPSLVESVPTAALASPVARPKNARLENRALAREGLDRMPRWEDALAAFLSEALGRG